MVSIEPGQMEWAMEVEKQEEMNRDRLERDWHFHCSSCSAHCSKGLFITQCHISCMLFALYLLYTALQLLSNLAAIHCGNFVIYQNKYYFFFDVCWYLPQRPSQQVYFVHRGSNQETFGWEKTSQNYFTLTKFTLYSISCPTNPISIPP